MSPTIFRIFALICQIIAVLIVIIIFKPSKKELRCAFWAGIVCAVYDFIIEAIAFKYNVWYCYGGLQILHVPLDMSVQFIFYGIMISIMSGFPALFRKWNFCKIFYGDAKYDLIHKIIFIILISFWGATGDFISKKFGVWENANGWTFYHTTLAWFSLNTLTIFYYSFIRKIHP